MRQQNNWVLPEGIEEILPPQAEQLEQLCRKVIDLYTRWGYQLVIPPLIEYLDSILTGTGKDLDLQTFKLTDQSSGRLLGIRADTTPQVARIDAHKLKRDVPTRLCYLGTVIHTKPETNGGSRSPLQVGAELYGHKGVESDVEILCLMIKTLQIVGVEKLHIDLGHVGIYQVLVAQAGLSTEQEAELFNILQRKAMHELDELLAASSLTAEIADMFRYLIEANGGVDILQEAQQRLAQAGNDIKQCLDYLQRVTELVAQRLPDCSLNFDLAELRGYHYHTGIMFAAYVPGNGQGIAFGGRYDAIGSAFGRARPATGFSTDLKNLLRLSSNSMPVQSGIFAPHDKDPAQLKMIDELRQQGEIVICELPDQTGNAQAMGCDRQLELRDDGWAVVKL
jgi:ATP phosphoribosyltransferase regulatory subunit